MDFRLEELDDILGQVDEVFAEYLSKKLSDNAAFLKLEHYENDSKSHMMTVLSYLIHYHQEQADFEDEQLPDRDIGDKIEWLLTRMKDCNFGAPLHLALDLGKNTLVERLLRSKHLEFNLNQRDIHGRSLLYLVLNTKNPGLFHLLIQKNVDTDELSSVDVLGENRLLHPLFQAIMLNFKEAVRILMDILCSEKPELPLFSGDHEETPICFACRMGAIDALEVLLIKLNEPSMLMHLNSNDNSAIDELCRKTRRDSEKPEALRGISMLLCHGVNYPSERFRDLLKDNVDDLYQHVEAYLTQNPHLSGPFVARCHEQQSYLKELFYSYDSFEGLLRRIFGQPKNTAFLLERLVLSEGDVLSDKLSDEKKFAMFVRRYEDYYQQQGFFTNPHSKMRWLIAKGMVDWDSVCRYADLNKGTRTHGIIEDMRAEIKGDPKARYIVAVA